MTSARPTHARAVVGRSAGLVMLAGVVTALVVVSIAVGSRDIEVADVVSALRIWVTGGTPTGFDEAAISVRIPRTVLAVLAGAALAISGAVMQGVTRNPLADPGILGVNMGASLAVVSGIAFFSLVSATSIAWVAIAGAGVAAVFVYSVGSMGRGGTSPLKLALAGAATSAALASLVNAIVLPRGDIAGGVQSWLIGGVGGASFDRIGVVLPFLAAGFAICLLAARALNSLALGDDLAAGLGQNVALARATAAVGAVLLCGAVTAVAGPIAFVGLVVPHLCRLIIGVDHRWLLPFSALGGAALVLAADVLGRIVARPTEIDVGIVAALIGAPFFVYVIRRQKVSAL